MNAIKYDIDMLNKKVVRVDKDIEIVEYLEGNSSKGVWSNIYKLGLYTKLYEHTKVKGYYVHTSETDIKIYSERTVKMTDEAISTIYITNTSLSEEEIIRLAIQPFKIEINNIINKINKIKVLTRVQKGNRELCRRVEVFYIASLDLKSDKSSNINIEKFECREYVDDSIEVYKCLVNGYSEIDILDKFKSLKIGEPKTFEGFCDKIKDIDNDNPRYIYKNVYEDKEVLYTVHYGERNENEIELLAFDRFKNHILNN